LVADANWLELDRACARMGCREARGSGAIVGTAALRQSASASLVTSFNVKIALGHISRSIQGLYCP